YGRARRDEADDGEHREVREVEREAPPSVSGAAGPFVGHRGEHISSTRTPPKARSPHPFSTVQRLTVGKAPNDRPPHVLEPPSTTRRTPKLRIRAMRSVSKREKQIASVE